ncbi:putative addiction module component [Methyloglobulus morosus KoM1]|uniref:Putative addiction module component n=1 Tax=Methyloglobulus morosus KoM1 TaxID=1116472 RepID=V5DWF2_9GAMM|nr:addiction module protein [Methyloglobulus morosus]ESS71671.1 putative addiction module component [Methyloglobulus morosus KoM1]
MNAVAISNMSLEEKIATMEQIWDVICQHQNVKSPDWHGEVLLKREESRLAGHDQPMDWQNAKKAIRQRKQ